MKYYEKCSLGDSLSAFFSESHGPVAVVIYISDEEARKHYETLKGFKAFIEGGRDEARSNYNKVKAELFPDQQQFDIFATFI